MLREKIHVCWTEYKTIIPINFEDSNKFYSEEDIRRYKEDIKNSEIKKEGYIVDFKNGLLNTVKAIIVTNDNKIVKVDIDKLTVIQNQNG